VKKLTLLISTICQSKSVNTPSKHDGSGTGCSLFCYGLPGIRTKLKLLAGHALKVA